jgi:hypothetical protein
MAPSCRICETPVLALVGHFSLPVMPSRHRGPVRCDATHVTSSPRGKDKHAPLGRTATRARNRPVHAEKCQLASGDVTFHQRLSDDIPAPTGRIDFSDPVEDRSNCTSPQQKRAVRSKRGPTRYQTNYRRGGLRWSNHRRLPISLRILRSPCRACFVDEELGLLLQAVLLGRRCPSR